MKYRKNSVTLFAFGAVAVGSFLFFPARFTHGGDDSEADRLDQIEKRLEELTRIVDEDPFYPKRPLTARVEALEDRLGDFDKNLKSDTRTDQRGFDDLDDRLVQQDRSIDALERKLADLQRNSPSSDDDAQRELQSQRRRLEQLDDAITSLKQRVEKLEDRR